MAKELKLKMGIRQQELWERQIGQLNPS